MADGLPVLPRIVIEFVGEHNTGARLHAEGQPDRGQRMIAVTLIRQWDADMHEAEKVAAAMQQRDLAVMAGRVRERNGRS